MLCKHKYDNRDTCKNNAIKHKGIVHSAILMYLFKYESVPRHKLPKMYCNIENQNICNYFRKAREYVFGYLEGTELVQTWREQCINHIEKLQ